MEEILYSPTELNTPTQKDEFIRYTIEDYSKKSSHREQSDLPKRCFSIVMSINKDYFEATMKEWHNAHRKAVQTQTDTDCEIAEKLLVEAIERLMEQEQLMYYTNIENTIRQAQEKSVETDKPTFVTIVFFKHSFCLSIFKGKICIIDSLNSPTGIILAKLLEIINTTKELNLQISRINTEQQSDNVSCPYLAVFNTTRLDKWFQEDIGNFGKLFNEEELPFSLIGSTQSIERIQNRVGIDIKHIIVKQLNKEKGLEIKFKTETKPKKYFNTKKPKQQIEKLISYIKPMEENIIGEKEIKLRNLRVSHKYKIMLEKFMKAKKEFLNDQARDNCNTL